MQLFLGIDLGTSYFKAGLFDVNGRLCGLGRQSVNKDTTATTCELPVDRFWSTIRACIAEALEQAGARALDIHAMSYASQANSFILLDKNDQPLTPLILWPDERGGAVHADLQHFCAQPAWQSTTGMGIPLSTHSCINKLKWYAAQPALWNEVSTVLTMSDYLTYSLTGVKQGDASTASLLGMLDVKSCTWWQEALALVPLREDQLVKPGRTGASVGMVNSHGAALTGLDTTTMFFLGGLDHHMAALGAGVLRQGMASESTGTVLAAVQYSDTYKPTSQICIGPGLDAQHFFNMTFDGDGVGFLEWYRQTKAPEFNIEQLMTMAERAGFRSYDLYAVKRMHGNQVEYGFEGKRSTHGHGHFVLAILEYTARQLDLLLQRFPQEIDKVVSTGGGARSRLWTQVKVDVTGLPFMIPACNEAACLGAAMLAATGAGVYLRMEDAIAGWIQYKESVELQ